MHPQGHHQGLCTLIRPIRPCPVETGSEIFLLVHSGFIKHSCELDGIYIQQQLPAGASCVWSPLQVKVTFEEETQLGGMMNRAPMRSTMSFSDVHITTQSDGLVEVLVCLELGITLMVTGGSLVIPRASLTCLCQLVILILWLICSSCDSLIPRGWWEWMKWLAC